MKLSMNSAMMLINGLALLDGYEKPYTDVSDVSRVVRVGYSFPAKTKLILAINRKHLNDVLTVFSEQRNALLSTMLKGDVTLSDPVKVEEFRKQEKEMLLYEEDIKLTSLTLADLNLDDQNNQNISPSTLVLLEPILSDFEK